MLYSHLWYIITKVGIARLIKIIKQPQDQKIKLQKEEFTIKLCFNAESLGEHDLSYKWYYLKAKEILE